MVRLCTVLFCTFGFTLGSWQASLPDLVARLGLSPLQLGLCLAAGFAGALPTMFTGGRLVTRFGSRAVLVGSGLAMAAALLGIALTGTYALLVPLVVVLLAGQGAFDVAINAVAIDIEQSSGRQILTSMHGAFSLSAAAGALCFGAYRSLDTRAGYVLVAVVLVVFVLVLSRRRSLPAASARPAAEGAGTRRRVLLGRDVLLVAGIVGVSFLGSGILENWSALYVRDMVSELPVLSAVGLAAFHGAMGLGRVLTNAALRWVDRLTAITACGLLMAVAMAWSLLAPDPAQAIVALFVVGILLSGIAPIGFSVAGDLRADRVGEVSSTVAIAGYSSFLVGPVLMGVLADAFGLRDALWSVAVVGVLCSLLAGALRVVHRPPDRSTSATVSDPMADPVSDPVADPAQGAGR